MAHRRRKVELIEAELSMTPMIDIVFQLLIYFILTFEPQDVMAHLDVFRPAPQDQKTELETPPNLIRITIYEDGYVINDRQVRLPELERVMGRLAAIEKNQTILIMVTAHSLHENLVSVLDLCAKTGLKNLSVVSTN
jgi:biopolymer transport protein ExbD